MTFYFYYEEFIIAMVLLFIMLFWLILTGCLFAFVFVLKNQDYNILVLLINYFPWLLLFITTFVLVFTKTHFLSLIITNTNMTSNMPKIPTC